MKWLVDVGSAALKKNTGHPTGGQALEGIDPMTGVRFRVSEKRFPQIQDVLTPDT
jgi:hypothetical protein